MPVSQELRAAFVERFVEFWRSPDPATLPKLLTDGVHLEAPLSPSTDGIRAAIETFENLLAVFPDLHADIHRWGAHDDGVFIEFTLRATVNGREIAIRAVDAILLAEDGRASARTSYFDPSPVLQAG